MVSIFSIRNFFVTAIAAVFACLLVTAPISPIVPAHTATPLTTAAVPMDVELTSLTSDALASLAAIPGELSHFSGYAVTQFENQFNDLGNVLQGALANFNFFSLFDPHFWDGLNSAVNGWFVDLNSAATLLIENMTPGVPSLCLIVTELNTDLTNLMTGINSDLTGFLDLSWL